MVNQTSGPTAGHINGVGGAQPSGGSPSAFTQQPRAGQQRTAGRGLFGQGRSSSAPPPGVQQRGRSERSRGPATAANPQATHATSTGDDVHGDHRDHGTQTSDRPHSAPPDGGMGETHQRLLETMQTTEKTHLTTMIMQAQFDQQKQVAETFNSMMEGAVDSANKVNEAMKHLHHH